MPLMFLAAFIAYSGWNSRHLILTQCWLNTMLVILSFQRTKTTGFILLNTSTIR